VCHWVRRVFLRRVCRQRAGRQTHCLLFFAERGSSAASPEGQSLDLRDSACQGQWKPQVSTQAYYGKAQGQHPRNLCWPRKRESPGGKTSPQALARSRSLHAELAVMRLLCPSSPPSFSFIAIRRMIVDERETRLGSGSSLDSAWRL
jgi:hypothetical protein